MESYRESCSLSTYHHGSDSKTSSPQCGVAQYSGRARSYFFLGALFPVGIRAIGWVFCHQTGRRPSSHGRWTLLGDSWIDVRYHDEVHSFLSGRMPLLPQSLLPLCLRCFQVVRLFFLLVLSMFFLSCSPQHLIPGRLIGSLLMRATSE